MNLVLHLLFLRILSFLLYFVLAGIDRHFGPNAVVVDDTHVGEAYGIPTDAMHEAVSMCARLEGLLLDPVYSGKGMAGLIHHVREGRYDADDDVVFIHTGGTPALFAYR